MKWLVLKLLKGYKKFISPMLGNHCRFQPTCSVYMFQAVESFGLVRGLILGIIRIVKCNPFHPGGIDNVPDKFEVIKGWKTKS